MSVSTIGSDVPPAVRDAVVAHVVEVKANTGCIDADTRLDACARLGVTPRHLRRLVRDYEALGATRRRSVRHQRIDLPDEWEAQVAYFLAAGNAVGAYRWLREQEALPEVIDLRTFQRRVTEWDPALRACAKGGYRAMVKHQFFNREHIPYRGYAYGTDHTSLPIQVLPERGTAPVWPWLSTVICLKTRVLLAYRLTAHVPNTDDNMHVLTEAIWGKETTGGVRIGGKPEFLRSDRGGDYISHALSLNLLNLGVQQQFTEPYSSWQNGRVEALNGTIDQDFAPSMPGYHPGGEAEYTRRVLRTPIPVSSLLRIDVLDRRLGEFFDRYNSRPHSSLNGQSPLEAWAADERVVPQADRPTIVTAMPSRGQRVLQHYGVEIRGEMYSHPTLARLREANVRSVEVRFHDHDLDHIEVLVDGEHQCTAVRTEAQSEKHRMGVLSTRKKQRRHTEALIREADRQRVMSERDRLRDEGVDESEWPSLPVVPDPDDTAAEKSLQPRAHGDLNRSVLDALNTHMAALGDPQPDSAPAFAHDTQTLEGEIA